MLPVNPDVFDSHIPAVTGGSHDVEDSLVVDEVVFERCLKAALAGTAGVKMAGMCHERFDLGVRQTEVGEVGVV